MANVTLYDDGRHKNVLLEDFSAGGLAVQSNQHVIVHDGAGMILDPGGCTIHNKVLFEATAVLGRRELHYIFFSHQDPDTIAAANGWLMATDADAYISRLWTRFVPHFGLDHLVEHRLKPIPDQGMVLDLDGAKLLVLPAHFIHSPGNFHLYDPVARILYSGDLGSSFGVDYRFVTDFAAHEPYIRSFHQRYMAGRHVLRAWAAMVRQLEIDVIAPQHGAIYRGKELVSRLIAWCEAQPCGMDLMTPIFTLPKG